jgi:AcrR family transcriptional regulator
MSMATGSTVGPSRRERVRAGTLAEIRASARHLLVAEGPHSVTLRAIAREMGMTAPALYRYYSSREDLLEGVCAELYDELTVLLAQEVARPGPAGEVLLRMARTFRDWAVAHPAEFGLIFGSPVPDEGDEDASPPHQAAMRFAGVWLTVFFRLWREQPFPVRSDAEIPAALVEQLSAYRATLADQLGPDVLNLPIGAMHVFLESWTQLYGVVALETFNHLHFCLSDVAPFFDLFMVRVGQALGISKP